MDIQPEELWSVKHDHWVNCCAFSPDGSTVLGSDYRTLRLWNITTGKQVWSFEHDGWINCCAFLPDGSTVLSGSADGTLRLLDAGTGKHFGPLNMIAC